MNQFKNSHNQKPEELHSAVTAAELEIFESDFAIAEIEYEQASRDPKKTDSEREWALQNLADTRDRFELALDNKQSNHDREQEFSLIEPEEIKAINEEYMAHDPEWDNELFEEIRDEFGFAFNDATMER